MPGLLDNKGHGKVGDALSKSNWGNYDLIVIDEPHNGAAIRPCLSISSQTLSEKETHIMATYLLKIDRQIANSKSVLKAWQERVDAEALNLAALEAHRCSIEDKATELMQKIPGVSYYDLLQKAEDMLRLNLR